MRKHILCMVLTLTGLMSDSACAQTIGYRQTLSQTTDILELNWADVLNARFRQAHRLGLLAQSRHQTRRAFETLATEPKSLGLARSAADTTQEFELTRYNALGEGDQWLKALTSFSRSYLFVDFSDALQHDWAKAYLKGKSNQSASVKVVAVGGNLPQASRSLQRRIFYDQQKRLTDRFFVTATPALVTLYGEKDTMKEAICVKFRRQTFDLRTFENENQ